MLYDYIDSAERLIIRDYIKKYASLKEDDEDNFLQSFTSLKKVLTPWSQAKMGLYNLLGHNFIISKEIEYDTNNFNETDDCNVKFFLQNYHEKIVAIINSIEDIIFLDNFRQAWDLKYLPKNLCSKKVTFENRGNKIVINPGEKMMRVFSKIASLYNINGYEEFRIACSKSTQKKKEKVYLSIHPLDYMTMSDNNCNWSSCMSWKRCAGYRAGTVEMMNSPYVIEAYTLGEAAGNDNWNNKKWRSQFLVVKNIIITKIKSYPYQCESLEKSILNWLAELSEKNLDIKYEKAIIETCNLPIAFKTNHMYNDFGTTYHYARLGKKVAPSIINYSGVMTCMYCGNEFNPSDNNQLVCQDCQGHYCNFCGCSIDNDYCEDGFGDRYCNHCYEHNLVEDAFTHERYLRDDCCHTLVLPDYLRNFSSEGMFNFELFLRLALNVKGYYRHVAFEPNICYPSVVYYSDIKDKMDFEEPDLPKEKIIKELEISGSIFFTDSHKERFLDFLRKVNE